MTEAEKLLSEESQSKTLPKPMKSPAEQMLSQPMTTDTIESHTLSPVSDMKSGHIGFKILAVVVFIVLILTGTYFAKISGPPILGYIISALAFILLPKIWRVGR